jgi:hypothetical protein
MSKIIYKIENTLDSVEFKDILIRSKLAERKPVDDFDRI